MRILAALIGVLFVSGTMSLLSANSAEARVVVKQSTRYYNVTGKTGEQVYRKMASRGPRAAGLRHALAATRGKIEVRNVKLGVKGRKCVVERADVHLTLTYFYPRWVSKSRGSRKARKAWDRYIAEIVRHEKVHGKYFRSTAAAFDRELKRMTGSVTTRCQGMVRKARSRSQALARKGNVRHAAFDRKEKRKTSKIRKLERVFYLSK